MVANVTPNIDLDATRQWAGNVDLAWFAASSCGGIGIGSLEMPMVEVLPWTPWSTHDDCCRNTAARQK